MTHLVIGTDDALIASLREKLRGEDPSSEIQLKSARDFDAAQLSDAPKVYVVGYFPDIVAAYGEKVVENVLTDAEKQQMADDAAKAEAVSDEVTASTKKRSSK